jgi:hypothetical protein
MLFFENDFNIYEINIINVELAMVLSVYSWTYVSFRPNFMPQTVYNK